MRSTLWPPISHMNDQKLVIHWFCEYRLMFIDIRWPNTFSISASSINHFDRIKMSEDGLLGGFRWFMCLFDESSTWFPHFRSLGVSLPALFSDGYIAMNSPNRWMYRNWMEWRIQREWAQTLIVFDSVCFGFVGSTSCFEIGIRRVTWE